MKWGIAIEIQHTKKTSIPIKQFYNINFDRRAVLTL